MVEEESASKFAGTAGTVYSLVLSLSSIGIDAVNRQCCWGSRCISLFSVLLLLASLFLFVFKEELITTATAKAKAEQKALNVMDCLICCVLALIHIGRYLSSSS